MFKAVSALQGVSFNDGIAEVRKLGLRGMITLRGDLADKKLIKAVKGFAGRMPEPRTVALKDDNIAAWMSSDELLLMVPHEDVSSTIETLNASLQGTHFLAANVSDARGVFEVIGPHAREDLVLAIERKVIVELRDQNVGQQVWPRHAAGDRTAWRGLLHYLFAAAAGLLDTGDLHHLHLGRDHVEEFADILAHDT